MFDSSADHIKPLLRIHHKKNIFKSGLLGQKVTVSCSDAGGSPTQNLTDDSFSDNDGESGTISKLDITYATNNDITNGAMTPVLGDASNNDQSHGGDMSPRSNSSMGK